MRGYMAAKKESISELASPDGAPLKLFATKKSWATWLATNHSRSTGIWLRMAKKGGALKSLSYAEALDVALCYGWIDGAMRPEDDDSWLKKFVPRAPRSLWSKINRAKAEALIASAEMQAAGLAAIEVAKKNGRWDAAYDSPATATVPDDLETALKANPAARQFFESLESANRYAILWRLQTVKRPETRTRKIAAFVEMLERREKFHN